ncbi:type II toxin-antitoxin system RelE/ParE family toxin [Candidatus Shapirobacteria bacterium CG10_big_fil_rev_8_21_14_0_10_40_9]|uniref:Type II toxin-antitoxin system RelE/ParE family toxin n=1 Tax=Candidatus Shapirobacteria bacterium CG10_big_fil_rev_8_21_14_0_10_40_9 TaxID=1974888 RepID=A0A2M8L3B2_9BACT|nr:MAG: type II toxin-antitoxin system RelE/ParE family toxin [Candidatus Shapirobacteria bacterium CG10_big_fil_rev_8_21_14_0_10_40_9]
MTEKPAMTVIFWTSTSGKNPVGDFIEGKSTSIKAKKKIIRMLKLLEKYGTRLLYSGYLEKLKGYDLYELRIKFSGVAYRILCFIKEATCWLLHIFKKKSGHTPQRHIDIALERKRELELSLAVI